MWSSPARIGRFLGGFGGVGTPLTHPIELTV